MQIETRNNKLEMQSVNNKALIEELDRLLERLRVPSEVFAVACYEISEKISMFVKLGNIGI